MGNLHNILLVYTLYSINACFVITYCCLTERKKQLTNFYYYFFRSPFILLLFYPKCMYLYRLCSLFCNIIYVICDSSAGFRFLFSLVAVGYFMPFTHHSVSLLYSFKQYSCLSLFYYFIILKQHFKLLLFYNQNHKLCPSTHQKHQNRY